ncbi:MAG: type II restriction endonuclease subunit M, partial [Blastocatellia bacterium]
MTTFLRILADKEKATNLLNICAAIRRGDIDTRIFIVSPESFRAVPGAPFAYWVSEATREVFKRLSAFECEERTARQGLATAEDFRFVRTWWEEPGAAWYSFAKGGTFSRFYADVYLVTKWHKDGAEVKAGICKRYPYLNGNAEFVAKNPQFYLRSGLTWPRRTSGLSFRALPGSCIFADKGPAIFVANDEPDSLLALCALVNSQAFGLLVSVQLARVELAQSFEVGLIQQTPIPELSPEQQAKLAALALRAWSLKRKLDTIEETSHAFALPAALRPRLGDYDPPAIEAELARIQSEIDGIAFDLYGFSEADRAVAQGNQAESSDSETEAGIDDEGDDEDVSTPIDQMAGLLSWAVGVAFGRFDWRLATGEREAPAEPEPFDPLPSKSPGMLPDGAAAFHAHAGILVDDQGHPHDLPRLIEEVLVRVEVPVPDDVRRWLQRDFFAFHLQRYSKSRRKAPIYWPLATTSGSYTLWLYYPSLTSQTLYTAI